MLLQFHSTMHLNHIIIFNQESTLVFQCKKFKAGEMGEMGNQSMSILFLLGSSGYLI